jgi:hypothetical protein
MVTARHIELEALMQRIERLGATYRRLAGEEARASRDSSDVRAQTRHLLKQVRRLQGSAGTRDRRARTLP